MFTAIIITIIIFTIIFILICKYDGGNQTDNFLNLNQQDKNNKTQNLNNRFSVDQINNRLKNNEIQQIANVDENILFNNRDYNENLSIDNKNNKYYYNDTINQSDINESAFNIVNSIDPIDYSNVETGIKKCNKECDGFCFENGYDGIATCYPKQQQGMDWGTLYKNPIFTYGYNAYGPNNLPK